VRSHQQTITRGAAARPRVLGFLLVPCFQNEIFFPNIVGKKTEAICLINARIWIF
jgi:hypothetical protein